MAKPLLRFTVGNCLQQGLDILVESIRRTTAAFGVDEWDWAVCYNGLNAKEVGFIREQIGELPVKLIAQNWATCPISDNCQSPRRPDGSFEYDGKRCGGTLWKVCPPRLRMESHEIVVDNDVVLLRKFPQIDEWLAQRDKVLLLEEPIRFYGRYDCLFPPDPPFLNSGFMGFPPGYNFGSQILEQWEKYGSYTNLSQADEQGLLTFTLNQMPSVRIRADQMAEVLHRDFRTKITSNAQAYHFTQANRMPNHHCWSEYQKVMKEAKLL